MTSKAVIVDDHPMCRTATAMALQIVDPAIEVAEASSLGEAMTLADGASVLTLDLGLPDNSGLDGLAALRAAYPDLAIMVISGAQNASVERQVARHGARGFLPKAAPISQMVDGLRTVMAGRPWFSDDLDAAGDDDFTRIDSLTPAQTRVLTAMDGGRLNKQIAHDLELSEITVKAHVKAILKKLGVANRTQAILMLQATRA